MRGHKTMTSRTLFQALLSSTPYAHEVDTLSHTQTHLSYIILTGQYAYKVKKPVNLGFQDFTSLEKRKYYCELECELNKFLAPDLYLGVVPITGTELEPIMNGTGPAIEWAIKMHQFPEDCLMSRVLEENKLTFDILDNIAQQLAQFHQTTDVCYDGIFGTPQKVYQPVLVNFEQLRRLLPTAEDLQKVDVIEAWAKQQFATLEPVFAHRKTRGFTRSCHGDLHLGNMVLFKGRPTIFDRIEFNESFRWTEVMSDVAFLAMDFLYNNRSDAAYYFINRYLEYTGDYEGLSVLRYYMSYRALVRSKIACFIMEQNFDDPTLATECLATSRRYLDLAVSFCQPLQPNLTLTHGIAGSGKSVGSEKWMISERAIRLRSDVERKRLHPGVSQEVLYTAQASARTFAYLQDLARQVLATDMPVIVDATFLKQSDRAPFIELAKKLGYPFQILSFPTPDPEELKNRLYHRLQLDNDPSDATYEVALAQQRSMEPFSEEEMGYVTHFDNTQEFSLQ
jgi:aminoglycoside phosphotransferase family enzyme/predicted kinase